MERSTDYFCTDPSETYELLELTAVFTSIIETVDMFFESNLRTNINNKIVYFGTVFISLWVKMNTKSI
jgi:hypothetical protein